jgi:ATP-binding cassette subfamily F protein 3
MSIIILKDIVLSYGERDLFDEISIDFREDQKIGVVGRNGAGKSTLLKVIAGQLSIDSGKVVLNSNKKIAFLPQEVVLDSDKSIFDELFLTFEKYTKLEHEKERFEKLFETNPDDIMDLLDSYQQVLDALAHFDRPAAEQQAIAILKGLGFKEEKFHDPVNTLSVGWKMRLVLAKLLLENADFYLFDEPTNHLDLVTKEWFLEFLRNAPFGYLLVTHDRYFLEKACDWIFELSRGKGTMYYGNYSKYIQEYERRRADLESAYQLQQKDIARKKETINRFRASASKAKMAQSMIKQLDKIEIIEIEPPEPVVSFSFPPLERAGHVVLKVKDLSYDYGSKLLFQHASCEITRGQKVALVAPNGMGKSTLFDLIAGKLPLQTGSVEFGHNVRYALFEQDQTKALDPHKTIIEVMNESCPDRPEQIVRSFLGAFLFRGDDVYKKIHMLSGGEKNRVAMVKVLLQYANFLLLDEPTNHLDLNSKSVLLQSLQQYPGTLFFVSHDHQFVQDLATDILELTPKGLHHYPGNYEEFLAYKKAQQPTVAPQQTEPQQEAQKKKRPKDDEDQKNAREMERTIQRLEQQIQQKSVQLTEQEYGSAQYDQTLAKIVALQRELDQAMAAWEKQI